MTRSFSLCCDDPFLLLDACRADEGVDARGSAPALAGTDPPRHQGAADATRCPSHRDTLSESSPYGPTAGISPVMSTSHTSDSYVRVIRLSHASESYVRVMRLSHASESCVWVNFLFIAARIRRDIDPAACP